MRVVNDQQQMFGRGRSEASTVGLLRAQALVAGDNPQRDTSGSAGGGFSCRPDITGGRFGVRALSLSHRLSILPRSRRPVRFSSSLRIGHYSGVLRDNPARRRPFLRSTVGCRRRAQSTPHQLSVNHAGAVVVHLKALSSVPVLVGSDANENGLTNAQISFAPGAKAND